MTVVDHPLKQIAELNHRIGTEVDTWECWKADLLWGAYLTLEFGPRRNLIGKDGPVAMGELRLLLDDAAWWVERGGKELLDCEDVLEGAAKSSLDEAFIGRRLLNLEWRDNLVVKFSDDHILVIEQAEEAGSQLLELRFANGDCVDIYANGVVETESMSE